jgi:hypothetical protein
MQWDYCRSRRNRVSLGYEDERLMVIRWVFTGRRVRCTDHRNQAISELLLSIRGMQIEQLVRF